MTRVHPPRRLPSAAHAPPGYVRLGDLRLWRRDPAGDTPWGVLCFADASDERTSLRPGETCYKLVTSEAPRDA